MTMYYMACDSTQHGDKKPGGKGWRLLSEVLAPQSKCQRVTEGRRSQVLSTKVYSQPTETIRTMKASTVNKATRRYNGIVNSIWSMQKKAENYYKGNK